VFATAPDRALMTKGVKPKRGKNPGDIVTLEVDGNNRTGDLDLEVNENGSVRSSQRNAVTYLCRHSRWSGVIALDVRNETPVFLRRPPAYVRTDDTYPREVSDVDVTAIIAWLSMQSGAEFPEGKVAKAIDLVAHRNAFDPAETELRRLQWDGISRIDNWLVRYLGSPDVGFAQVVGAKFLIAAVARVLQPGCQVDHVLILEGAQGIGKTTALRILGGAYHRGDPPPLGTREAKEALRGAWLIELGELDSMNKSEMSAVKNYLTQTADHYRAPYDRRSKTHPRRVIFVGTTNDSEYLRDHTGGRRFWPIECGRIDLAALARDRDQLWAEAVVRYGRGEPWHLTKATEYELAAQAQEQRADVDPWEERVGDLVSLQSEVRLSELMRRLEVPVSLQGQREKNRIARILQRFGYRRRQVRDGLKRCYVYSREDRKPPPASPPASPVSPPPGCDWWGGPGSTGSGSGSGDTGDDGASRPGDKP
jgi:putative DNA primase/helicase